MLLDFHTIVMLAWGITMSLLSVLALVHTNNHKKRSIG